MRIKVTKTPKLKCPDFGCKRKFSKYKTLVKHCQVVHFYDDTLILLALAIAALILNRQLNFPQSSTNRCRWYGVKQLAPK